MRNYLKLLRFLKDYKRLFGVAVGAMLIASAFRIFELSMLVPIIDRIFNQKAIIPPNQLPEFLSGIVGYLNGLEPAVLFRTMPFVILIGMVVKHGFIYLYEYLMNDITQRVMRDIRLELYMKIQHLSLDYFSKKRTGELMSRITYDVGVIESAVSYSVTDLFVQGFTVVGFVTTVLVIHFKAAVIIFFVVPMVMWPMTAIGKKLRKLARSSQERMADINSLLLETISGIKIVKAFSTEEYEIERFRVKSHDFYKLFMKRVKRLKLMAPITELFGAVCAIIMFLWLGRQVLDQQLSFGIFIMFFACMMSMISPIKKLGNVNALVQQALSANERIHDILDQEPSVQEKEDAVTLPMINRDIRLNNVSFRYEQTTGKVLRDINLDIQVGHMVAIVGPTGTGKSTLANLIPRFYDPIEGSVTIDDTDLRDVSLRSLRTQIGIVTQETFLFNDTIKANISYGTLNVSDERIEEAARQAYAHRFITELPHGYDTVIGERGFRLSGGEKQRLAIARAILKNPPILILDEATSQLDSESERYVQDALNELMRGRTVVAIAHRLSTIKKADKIIVLQQGKIVGAGRHDELLDTCDLYRRLHETQFQM